MVGKIQVSILGVERLCALFPFGQHPDCHHEGAHPGVQLQAEPHKLRVQDAQPVLQRLFF